METPAAMEQKCNSRDDVKRERKHERQSTNNVTLLRIRVTNFSSKNKKTNNPFCVCTDEIHATVNNLKKQSILFVYLLDTRHCQQLKKNKQPILCVYSWDTRHCQQYKNKQSILCGYWWHTSKQFKKKTNNPFCVCTDEIHATVNNLKKQSILFVYWLDTHHCQQYKNKQSILYGYWWDTHQ